MSDYPFTVAMLAERWSCSRQHIIDLIDAGDLRAFRLGAKLLRISAEEVARWESGAGATTDPDNTASASSRAKAARYGMKAASATDTVSESEKRSRRDLRLMRSLDGASS